jgi:hypothetical protein
MLQHSLKRLKSISLNLTEQVSCLSFKIYFVIVKELIVLDYYYVIVIDYLSDLDYRVRLVSVL